ncbi:MAG: NAD(P)-dependent oxidoreductase [Candidatus Latescibacteria bacterium]|jgi:nucleoside-diphosphate-sugar epimerase|nr:NAD(P)-dependent oxidoreductase [Candidatus Latescibacterota bacterium]
MHVLITGAAGDVGSPLVAGLKDRYELRGFDRVPMPELKDTIVGDIADYQTVLKAMENIDAVIHLAGVASSRHPWEVVLQSNFIGTYNIFEAARECGIKRVAFASRAGLLKPYPSDLQRNVDMLPRPTSYYSISKAFGENLGYMYSVQHNMEVVCVRIGNFNPERDQPEHPHHLSHGDAIRVFEQAIIHPGVTYEVVFGVSDSNWPLYDLEHGRSAIGYAPQDFADVPQNQRT